MNFVTQLVDGGRGQAPVLQFDKNCKLKNRALIVTSNQNH